MSIQENKLKECPQTNQQERRVGKGTTNNALKRQSKTKGTLSIMLKTTTKEH